MNLSDVLWLLMLVGRDGYSEVEGVYSASFLTDVCRDAGLWKRDEDRKSVLAEFLLTRHSLCPSCCHCRYLNKS